MKWPRILAFLEKLIFYERKPMGKKNEVFPEEPRWKHFTESEVEGLSRDLVDALDDARSRAGIVFLITSGLRTEDQNASLSNAVPDSSHLTGQAVDLAAASGLAKFKIVKGLVGAGFNRIGIYKTHVHADVSKDKPQDVLWLG